MWVVQELALYAGREPLLASGIGKPSSAGRASACVSRKDVAIMGVGEK